MDRDTIFRLAREAGLGGFLAPMWDLRKELERFATLVAAHEREACAKVCDDWPNGRDDVDSIAAAIRSRT